MMQRRRRTLLVAGILTVVGLVIAAHPGTAPGSAAGGVSTAASHGLPGGASLPVPKVALPAVLARSAGAQIPAGCPPSAVACVDLSAHLTWLQRYGRVSYGPVRALGGTGDYRTPLGVFHVVYKVLHGYSTEFNEPMPYAVYFAPGGIAFHEGSLVRSSHGCVHLSAAAAAIYFASLRVGAEVDVF